MATVDGALTTIQRVKDRIGKDTADQDTLLERLVNGVTSFIENRTNRRKHGFKETSISDEVYNGSGLDGIKRKHLILNHAPVDSISSFQYDNGTNDSPNWTDFINNEYNLAKPEIGIIQVDGGIPRGVRNIRVSYTAGYKIDFSNTTDESLHTLPHDLSDLAERLVVKFYKRRDDDGRASISFNRGDIEFRDYLDAVDKQVLANYNRSFARHG